MIVGNCKQMQKCYSVELRNAGVADVAVRQDSRIMVSGGWDGRFLYTVIFMCVPGVETDNIALHLLFQGFSAKQHIIGKDMKVGAEQRKFQLHNTFHIILL